MKTREYIVTIANVKLKCHHCRQDRFTWREGLLDTKTMTFIGLEYFNKTSDQFVCTRCGFIHTFFVKRKLIKQKEFVLFTPEEYESAGLTKSRRKKRRRG